MGRRSGGYSSYRGRRTLTDILKLIAVVLGVLAVVLLAVLWLLGGGEPDGGGAGQSGQADLAQQADLSQPDASQSGSGNPGASGEEAQQPAAEAMRALELPVSAITDGTAAARLEQAGANALVLTMKDTEGRLSWNTAQPLAVSLGLGAEEEVNDLLRAWNQGEVYTVARVCCFRDNTVPYNRNDMALRAGYGNWRDELGLRWLSPASEEARSYLAQLCGELAELGFDEIVLECAAFPTAGEVELMLTDGVDREQVVSDFLTQARAAAEPWGTRISLRLESGALTGNSGLSAGQLEQGRIWTEEGSDALLAQAGITPGEDGVVELTASLEGEGDAPRAMLS